MLIAPEFATLLKDPLNALRGDHLYIVVNGQFSEAPPTTRIRTLAIVKRGIAAGLQSASRASVERL